MNTSGFHAKERADGGAGQLGLFPGLAQRDESDRKAKAERERRADWLRLWSWQGPTAGGYGRIATIAPRGEDGRTLYAYTERVRFIEERDDGTWLAEIAMGQVRGALWPKDGRRVLLSVLDIDPPYYTSHDEHMRTSHV